MDWFKVESSIATNPKVDELSHGAYRVMTYLWGHAMRHETGGHVPSTVARLVPHVTPGRIRELVHRGFLHPNGDGWLIHDWDEHQREAVLAQQKKRRDAERKKEAYWASKDKEESAE